MDENKTGRRGSLGLTSLSLKVPGPGGGGLGLSKHFSKSSTGLNTVRPGDLRRATLSKIALDKASGGGSPKQARSSNLTVPGLDYLQARRNSDILLKVIGG